MPGPDAIKQLEQALRERPEIFSDLPKQEFRMTEPKKGEEAEPLDVEAAIRVEKKFLLTEETQKLERRMRQPLNVLGEEIIAINRANGWNVCKPEDWANTDLLEPNLYKLGTVLALIHSEVSEALEAVRARDRANFEEELADVLIRVLDCAAGLGVDMDDAVRAKLERNKTRGYRHGGKAV